MYTQQGKGVNVMNLKLTEEVLKNCHENGKKVGVWIDIDLYQENREFYEEIMDKGVDFFCSDYPLAMV